MKAFVITVKGNDKSEQVADRCIKSGNKFAVDVQKHYGYQPKDNPQQVAASHGIDITRFREKYSRFENCLAAFLSHHSLWIKSVKLNQPILILEHDAVFNDFIADNYVHKGVLSLGAPSYGKFKIPPILGVNDLCSKQYLPGAHAYIVTPRAAAQLIDKAIECAGPTDLYISNANFDFIQELYPWPISADDSFTTIQNETGCLAKHHFKQGKYEIVNV